MTWFKSTDPDAYELSQVFQVWARKWAHVGATCESGGLTKVTCREYGLEICFGLKSETLSISVVAPPNTASNTVLCESDSPVAPWTLFQVTYGRPATVQETVEWVHDPYQEEDRASGHRMKRKTGHVVGMGITMLFLLGQEGMLPVVA